MLYITDISIKVIIVIITFDIAFIVKVIAIMSTSIILSFKFVVHLCIETLWSVFAWMNTEPEMGNFENHNNLLLQMMSAKLNPEEKFIEPDICETGKFIYI